MAKKKLETVLIADALENAFGELEQLASEMRDWYEGMPENFQNGDKGEQVNEAADNLEQIQSIDLPDWLDDAELGDGSENPSRASVEVWPLPRRASRADRRDYAVSLLQGVKDHVDTLLYDKGEKWEHKDDAESFVSELDDAIGYAEDVSFPGMYG